MHIKEMKSSYQARRWEGEKVEERMEKISSFGRRIRDAGNSDATVTEQKEV